MPGERTQRESVVDEIQRSMELASLSNDQSKANNPIQIVMARLEDEFRSILIAHTSPIKVELLLESSSSSSRITYSPKTSSNEMRLGEQEFKSFDFEEESLLTKELELEESRRSNISYLLVDSRKLTSCRWMQSTTSGASYDGD
nr:exocyst complex component EXO70A1-like [Ipomoea batatas]